MIVAGKTAQRAWGDLHLTSHAHVGRMILSAFEQDLGEAVADLAATAEPFAGADPSIPAMQRALAGDTVAALSATPTGAEVAVILPDAEAPDTTAVPVRYAVAPMEADVAAQVARTTGYLGSLYLNGRLWGGSEPPPGPPTLGEAVLLEVSANRGGTRLPGTESVLQATSPQAGTAPALVALAAPGLPAAPAVGIRFVLVQGLLILFSALAGWIQLARPPNSKTVRPGPWSMVTLALVPALAAALFLVHLTRTFETSATDVTARDLSRGLAVARVRGLTSSPSAVRGLTGFQTTVVRSGEVLESTFPSHPTALAGLPSPPRSFTISGTVDTPEGPSLYVALRRERSAVVIVTTKLPVERVMEFRWRCLVIGLVLLAWLLLAGTWLLVTARAGRRAKTQ